MTKDSHTQDPTRPMTVLGAAIEQIHDHRVRADEPEPRLVFCPTPAPAIVDKNAMYAIDAD